MDQRKKQKLENLVFTINGGNSPVKTYFVDGVYFHIEQKYTPFELIGEGAYGAKVCSAFLEDAKKPVVIKKIPISFLRAKIFETLQVYREMMILSFLNHGEYRHPSIIRLVDIMIPITQENQISEDFEEVYLVYGYVDTDLHKVIKDKQCTEVEEIKNYFTQMLKGVEFMHSKNVLHRDLKPKNILVDYINHGLQICDFGWSCVDMKRKMSFDVGTRYYRAPELILECDTYDAAIDIWSLGCIFGEILLGKPVFDNGENEDELERIVSVIGPLSDDDLNFIENHEKKCSVTKLLSEKFCFVPNIVPFAERFPPNVDGSAICLLQSMLSFNPKKRITATESLKNDFIAATVERWNRIFIGGFITGQDNLLPVDWPDDTNDKVTVKSLIWGAMKNVKKENPDIYHDLLCDRSLAFSRLLDHF